MYGGGAAGRPGGLGTGDTHTHTHTLTQTQTLTLTPTHTGTHTRPPLARARAHTHTHTHTHGAGPDAPLGEHEIDYILFIQVYNIAHVCWIIMILHFHVTRMCVIYVS